MRKLVPVLLLVAFAAVASAQTTFEVASVKPAPPLDPQKILSGQQRVGMKVAGNNVDVESVALPELLFLAFKVRPSQMVGPSWLNLNEPLAAMSAARFDVHARLPAGGTEEQVPKMLQALLAERFKLEVHRETKEQNAYALVVGRNGSKLEPSPEDDPAAAGAPTSARPDPIQVQGTPQNGMTLRGPNGSSMKMKMGPDGSVQMVAEKMTIEQLAASIERFVDRPVVDMTGLKGSYRMTLDLSMADLMAAARGLGGNVPPVGGAGGGPAAGPADPGGNSIFQSVEKMGLKLEPRKSQVEYLVIDRLEQMPTED